MIGVPVVAATSGPSAATAAFSQDVSRARLHDRACSRSWATFGACLSGWCWRFHLDLGNLKCRAEPAAEPEPGRRGGYFCHLAELRRPSGSRRYMQVR
jgi:hypothetical protein